MAWEFVAIGSATTASSGNLTLTEPTGAQQSDLLVACISYRSTAAFTLPAGWSLVATQQSSGNTTVDGTGSIGSGLMAYIVRGSSAPSLIFTRTSGDVAFGRIVAYRGVGPLPYDTGSANTLSGASVTVTTGTITTAKDDELIVVAACGARNSTFTAFDAATAPATGSGTGSTATNNPIKGEWSERGDSGTATGADCSLAIADARKETAGASGTIQATASSSARHVMIAGAFKLAPETPSSNIARVEYESRVVYVNQGNWNSMLYWPSKDPNDVAPYEIDWSAFLGTDTISTSTWTVGAGITKDSDTKTSTTTTAWLSGGTDLTSYVLTNRIVTAGGQTRDQSVAVLVRAR